MKIKKLVYLQKKKKYQLVYKELALIGNELEL